MSDTRPVNPTTSGAAPTEPGVSASVHADAPADQTTLRGERIPGEYVVLPTEPDTSRTELDAELASDTGLTSTDHGVMARREPGMPDAEAGAINHAPTSPTLNPIPYVDEDETELSVLGTLSYRQLVWRKFRRSKLAIVGLFTLTLFYIAALFAEFFAPYDYLHDNIRLRYVPPQRIQFVAGDGFHLPFVYGLKQVRDPESLELIYTPDTTKRSPVQLFHHGDSYRLFGLIPGNIHLFGSDGPLFLLGTDRMGRDLLSRIIYGGRISLTVGIVGVLLSILLGSFLGTLSGYYGGVIDTLMQRVIELLSAFPAIPLWMALAAALPPTWTGLQIYFGITVILSLLSWGGLARQVRGKVLAMREQDYVLAARAAGANTRYILLRHMMPTAYSHIIVIATLSIPGMILGETALSFLGLGIRPPMTSWGVLLEEAQRVTVVLHYPWLLFAAVPVLVVVVAYNFVGDALRDAADPYAS